MRGRAWSGCVAAYEFPAAQRRDHQGAEEAGEQRGLAQASAGLAGDHDGGQ